MTPELLAQSINAAGYCLTLDYGRPQWVATVVGDGGPPLPARRPPTLSLPSATRERCH